MGTCGDVVPDGAPAAPAVGVVSYVLADLDSGEVLAARNPHARLRPASLMKTLTGLLVAQRLPLDETITGTQEDADQEGTRVGIGAGGRYTIRQVFDSMMMASGNDAAHALAVRLTGSVPATVDLMNTTARRLGALDTRAATPSGLDGPGMQTSAYDLASIFRVAMREEPFAQAVATREIPFPGFGASPPFVVANDNKLLTSGYEGYIGGKTGFTDDARHTFIGAAERNGRRLVVVLMRGEQRPVPMYEQASALLDHGFALPDLRGVGTLTDSNPAEPAEPGTTSTPDPDAAAPGSGATTSWGTPVLLLAVVAAVGGLFALRAGRR
ncbi:D-alanyl-D-alanine carboxypeptidase family protein [Actinomycetospora sp. CA-053990]|uniref:D-alanyl-D-alanine carboxypeptidase family protein n=1 Tax=Actinomycetospora sp. CA-053990 TaxID=3239891 RepID=UPI003D926D99